MMMIMCDDDDDMMIIVMMLIRDDIGDVQYSTVPCLVRDLPPPEHVCQDVR